MKLAVLCALIPAFFIAANARAETSPAALDPVFHLEARPGVRLEQMTPQGWRDLCGAPCDQRLALGPEYRVTGPGIRASRPVKPQVAADGRVVIRVESTTSSAVLPAGIVFASLGFVALSVAAAMSTVSTCVVRASDSYIAIPYRQCGRDSSSSLMLTAIGIPTLVAGVALMLAGVQPTRVSTERGPMRRVETRQPEWQSRRQPAPSTGPAVMIPILSGRF